MTGSFDDDDSDDGDGQNSSATKPEIVYFPASRSCAHAGPMMRFSFSTNCFVFPSYSSPPTLLLLFVHAAAAAAAVDEIFTATGVKVKKAVESVVRVALPLFGSLFRLFGRLSVAQARSAPVLVVLVAPFSSSALLVRFFFLFPSVVFVVLFYYFSSLRFSLGPFCPGRTAPSVRSFVLRSIRSAAARTLRASLLRRHTILPLRLRVPFIFTAFFQL